MTTKDPEILKLIEIAKNELPKDKSTVLPPVKRFMVSDGVENGDEFIPASLIYDRYLKWTELMKIQPVSSIAFFKELILYVEKRSTKKGMFYKLSPKGFNMSPEYLVMINEAKRISHGKKTLKKKL